MHQNDIDAEQKESADLLANADDGVSASPTKKLHERQNLSAESSENVIRVDRVGSSHKFNERGSQPILLKLLVYSTTIYFLFCGAQGLIGANLAKSWTATTGIVMTAGYSQGTSPKSDILKAPYAITYRYTVDKRTFTGSKINFCPAFSQYSMTKGQALSSLIEVCKPGLRVRIYYNPADPQQAVLDRAPDFGDYITLTIGLLVLLLVVTKSQFLYTPMWGGYNTNPDLGAWFKLRR